MEQLLQGESVFIIQDSLVQILFSRTIITSVLRFNEISTKESYIYIYIYMYVRYPGIISSGTSSDNGSI